MSFVLRMTRKNQGSISSLQKTLRNSLKLGQLERRKLHKSHLHPIDLTAALGGWQRDVTLSLCSIVEMS